MNKISNRSTFRKLTKLIDGNIGMNLRKANNEYKYSKSYTCRDHIMSMLFLQISGCNGLRDIDEKYRKSSIYIKEFKDIKIIDSSIVNIGKGLSPELYHQDEKSAIRISTLFSYGKKLPSKINIVPAKIGERTCIDGYVDSIENIYVFDKGYFKYSWYDEMTDKKQRFITRQQSNAITEEYLSTSTDIENVYDYLVTMGSNYSKNKTRHKYREILYFTKDSDEEFRLVTNIYDMPAEDIISLYKKRWDIELFFKWIKQHLAIKKWVGRSLNAISIQIYSALIIYVLLLLIKYKYESGLSIFNIFRKLSVNILEKYALRNILLR